MLANRGCNCTGTIPYGPVAVAAIALLPSSSTPFYVMYTIYKVLVITKKRGLAGYLGCLLSLALEFGFDLTAAVIFIAMCKRLGMLPLQMAMT